MWIQYNGRVPKKHDARRCWARALPDNIDIRLFTETVSLISKCKKDTSKACVVIHRGDPDFQIDPLTAVAQLYCPDPWNPMKLLDLRLPVLPDGILKAPPGLKADPDSVDNLQLMLTPKYSWTQLHFGMALTRFGDAPLILADNADGLSIITGKKGKKIFATFPNSPKNSKYIRHTSGREAKLEEIAEYLELGITYTIEAGEAIDLPMNCFHAVWTLEGCFLALIDFTTPDSAKAYSTIISTGLHQIIGSDRQKDLFEWFLTCLNVTLGNEHVTDALFVWIDLYEYVKEWAWQNPAWKQKAIVLWEGFLSSPSSCEQICPCRRRGSVRDFVKHFRSSHLFSFERKRSLDKSNEATGKSFKRSRKLS